jgi:hypothetical protein
MKLVKYLEFNQSDLNAVKSFRIKDSLNPKLWDNFEINGEVTSIKKIRKLTEPLETIKEIVGKHYKGDVILDQQNAKGYTEAVTDRKTKKTSFDFI